MRSFKDIRRAATIGSVGGEPCATRSLHHTVRRVRARDRSDPANAPSGGLSTTIRSRLPLPIVEVTSAAAVSFGRQHPCLRADTRNGFETGNLQGLTSCSNDLLISDIGRIGTTSVLLRQPVAAWLPTNYAGTSELMLRRVKRLLVHLHQRHTSGL